MNAARPAEILRRLERADGAPGTDAELLARFVATRDASAFAELVRRHGPLVMGVCRRVTGQAQDAEDAFQATFLVLAKKAGALRNPELLGNYLYGVAFRVAWRAKRSALRRRTREVAVAALPDPPAPSPRFAMPELQPILDEELAALPACYREAIVLCDLRGASREAAAAALGVPEGTLSSRLANGRKKLAARLTRRGVTLATTALPVVLTEARAQAVPNELITKTCELVADWSAGGAVPPPLAKLANGGLTVRTMLMLGAVMVVSVAGAVFAAQSPEAPPVDPPKPPVAAREDANPQPMGEPKAKDKPAEYTSAPRKQRAFDVDMSRPSTVRWNMTGTHLAVRGTTLGGGGEAKKDRPVVRLVDVGKGTALKSFYTGEGSSLVAVAPDGTIVTDLREYHLISGLHQLKFWTGQVGMPKAPGQGASAAEFPASFYSATQSVDLDLPETHGYAFAADGKTFRTIAWRRSFPGDLPAQLEVLEVSTATGKSVKSLLKVDFGANALSPNGKRLAVFDRDKKRMIVYDLDRGEKVTSAELTEPADDVPATKDREDLWPVVFSPDGRRLMMSRGIARTHVLNADTGEWLPALEGTNQAEVSPGLSSFTGDGRLLVAAVTPYKITPRPALGGKKQTSWQPDAGFLTVWDTQTGKVLKTWRQYRASAAYPAFNPTRPLLAILEPNGESATRVGFWDFAAEVEKK